MLLCDTVTLTVTILYIQQHALSLRNLQVLSTPRCAAFRRLQCA